jgi:hypothetical protein
MVSLTLKIVNSNVMSSNAGKTYKCLFKFIFNVFAKNNDKAIINY